MENINNTAKTTEEEKIRIAVEPAEFDGQAKCLFMNTVDLADKIGSIFSPVFGDYYGCKVRVNDGLSTIPVVTSSIAPGALYADIFFKENAGSAQGVRNIIKRSELKGTDLNSRLGHVLGGMASRMYNLTDETKEMLEEFVPNPKNARWNERILERTAQVQTFGGRDEIVVQVSGLSVELLLAKLYGSKVGDAVYDYAVVPVKQTYNTAWMQNPTYDGRAEFLVQITQMDRKILNDVSKALGTPFASPVDFNVYNR